MSNKLWNSNQERSSISHTALIKSTKVAIRSYTKVHSQLTPSTFKQFSLLGGTARWITLHLVRFSSWPWIKSSQQSSYLNINIIIGVHSLPYPDPESVVMLHYALWLSLLPSSPKDKVCTTAANGSTRSQSRHVLTMADTTVSSTISLPVSPPNCLGLLREHLHEPLKVGLCIYQLFP